MTGPMTPQPSLEAVAYQGRSLLFFDIAAEFERLRALPEIQWDDVNDGNLAGIVAKRTGMRVDNHVDSFAEGFFAEPPLLDAKNPYYKLVADTALQDGRKDTLERFQRCVRLAKDSLAWVDLPKAQVRGVFSTMPCRVFLSTDVIEDRDFSSEELAAMYIHELGHLFSFFETLAYSTVSNVVIAGAVDALRGVEDKSARYKLVSQALAVFTTPEKDTVSAIAESDNNDVIQALILRTFEEGEQDRTRGLSVDRERPTNTRSLEYLADQFAVRNGAALPLATAQHKMAKQNRMDYGRGNTSFFAMQAVRLGLLAVTFAAGTSVGLIALTIVSLLQTVNAANSDSNADPSERIGFVKADLVQILKNPKLDPQMRKQVLSDVEAIDALRDTIKEHQGIFRYLWRTLSPRGRSQSKLREFQKGLEDLVNNDLFVQASRLRSH